MHWFVHRLLSFFVFFVSSEQNKKKAGKRGNCLWKIQLESQHLFSPFSIENARRSRGTFAPTVKKQNRWHSVSTTCWFYNFNSPILSNSTMAWDRPLTPSFWMELEIWFRTVFSLINSSSAISLVVLSWTSSSNTSFSLFVNNGLRSKRCSLTETSYLLAFAGLERASKAAVTVSYVREHKVDNIWIRFLLL